MISRAYGGKVLATGISFWYTIDKPPVRRDASEMNVSDFVRIDKPPVRRDARVSIAFRVMVLDKPPVRRDALICAVIGARFG